MLDMENVIRQHIEQLQSLQLATLNDSGYPEISYAPFILHENAFFILLSELASHYSNLNRDARCSVMLIEDEHKAPNPFARTRLTLQCEARFVTRQDPLRATVITRMQARHGETVNVLDGLPDFHLCRLEIAHGRFISGFAKAYTFNRFKIDRCQHIAPR
ncbi:MAG: pyridoxamine 5'-phosphate oxidase family protein [Oleiphilaceae bacterium]|nr:pyridoxamine 5'-phosphate oxidase family protein [Oleiphilaceae bacterium]